MVTKWNKKFRMETSSQGPLFIELPLCNAQCSCSTPGHLWTSSTCSRPTVTQAASRHVERPSSLVRKHSNSGLLRKYMTYTARHNHDRGTELRVAMGVQVKSQPSRRGGCRNATRLQTRDRCKWAPHCLTCHRHKALTGLSGYVVFRTPCLLLFALSGLTMLR